MNPRSKKIPLLFVAALLLLFLSIALAILLAQYQVRATRHPPLLVLGQVNDFSLTNELGRASSLGDLRGQVWVADIIFTRCPGPCIRMTRQMKELQDALPVNDRVKFVSLTTDPDYDTPPILKAFAEKYGADLDRWLFLTGTKKQIADVAGGSLKFSAVEKAPAERQSADDLFVHSTIFALVDKRGQLRGVFETGGEGVNWPKSKLQLLASVRALEREP
jgi:protein SCO1